jgi:hypothetical protein
MAHVFAFLNYHKLKEPSVSLAFTYAVSLKFCIMCAFVLLRENIVFIFF